MMGRGSNVMGDGRGKWRRGEGRRRPIERTYSLFCMSSKRAFVVASQKTPPNRYGRNSFRGGAACKELE